MPLKRLIQMSFILSIAVLTTACGTTSQLRVAQIPLRADLTGCLALPPIQPDALPPMRAEPAERSAQIEERAFWMRRDLAQTANNRDNCNKQMELVALIRANNEGPEH